MATVKDIFDSLCVLAPLERKMSYDNPGLLVGEPGRTVHRVLAALDVTEDVIGEAAGLGAELVVSHHPVIFGEGMKAVLDTDPTGMRIIALVRSGISAICMHTNLDVSAGGVNDALAKAVGIAEPGCITADGVGADGREYGIGRFGLIRRETPLADFLPFVKSALGANGLRYLDAGKPVRKVAVCGGAGGDELAAVAALGCDTYVTADVKYNVFLDAASLGLNLIDAGHFPTENVVVPVLAEYIRAHFPQLDVRVSALHVQPESFI